MDKKSDLINRVIVDPSKLKHIKITCRCGVTTTEAIPGEVIDSGMVPVISCKCGTDYAVQKDRLIRLDKHGRPEKLIAQKPKVTSAIQDRQLKNFAGVSTEAEALDEVEKIMEDLRKQGRVVRPSDFRTIN